MQPNSQGILITRIIAASKKDDDRQLVKLLKDQTLSGNDNFISQMRAIELQLKLLYTYKKASEQLAILLKNRPTQAVTDEMIINLTDYGVHLEKLLKDFSETVDACIQAIGHSEFTLDFIVRALNDEEFVRPAIHLIQNPDAYDQDWLVTRAFVTKAGVQDSIGDIVTELKNFSVNAKANLALTQDDIDETDQIITRGIEVAKEELDMAVDGLMPGAKL